MVLWAISQDWNNIFLGLGVVRLHSAHSAELKGCSWLMGLGVTPSGAGNWTRDARQASYPLIFLFDLMHIFIVHRGLGSHSCHFSSNRLEDLMWTQGCVNAWVMQYWELSRHPSGTQRPPESYLTVLGGPCGAWDQIELDTSCSFVLFTQLNIDFLLFCTTPVSAQASILMGFKGSYEVWGLNPRLLYPLYCCARQVPYPLYSCARQVLYLTTILLLRPPVFQGMEKEYNEQGAHCHMFPGLGPA